MDNRFIGLWGVGVLPDTRITADQSCSDGLWFRVGKKASYALPSGDTLHYGHYEDRTPFVWKRVGSGSTNSIIGSWRHEPVPKWTPPDEGEDVAFAVDGTYRGQFDSDATQYFGTFALSQDANGLWITTAEYFLRLQTVGNAFIGTPVYGPPRSGTFVFSNNEATLTLTYTTPTQPPLVFHRF